MSSLLPQSCKYACLFFISAFGWGGRRAWAAATLREQGLPAPPTEAEILRLPVQNV